MREKFLTEVDRIHRQESLGSGLKVVKIKNDDEIQDSILTIQDDFSKKELSDAFKIISRGSAFIDKENLTEYLVDENEDSFKKIEMIRLLDKTNKKEVSENEFLEFFQKDFAND